MTFAFPVTAVLHMTQCTRRLCSDPKGNKQGPLHVCTRAYSTCRLLTAGSCSGSFRLAEPLAGERVAEREECWGVTATVTVVAAAAADADAAWPDLCGVVWKGGWRGMAERRGSRSKVAWVPVEVAAVITLVAGAPEGAAWAPEGTSEA